MPLHTSLLILLLQFLVQTFHPSSMMNSFHGFGLSLAFWTPFFHVGNMFLTYKSKFIKRGLLELTFQTKFLEIISKFFQRRGKKTRYLDTLLGNLKDFLGLYSLKCQYTQKHNLSLLSRVSKQFRLSWLVYGLSPTKIILETSPSVGFNLTHSSSYTNQFEVSNHFQTPTLLFLFCDLLTKCANFPRVSPLNILPRFSRPYHQNTLCTWAIIPCPLNP